VLIAVLLSGTLFSQDTIPKSVKKDTLKKDSNGDSENSAIKSKVTYNSRDSIRFDMSNQKVFLYGDAKVIYEDMEIKAGYIEFDMEHNIVFAHGARDSLDKPIIDTAGRAVGNPVFKQGAESFDATQMTYNFQTKKGKIKNITTKEGEGVIHAKDAKKDSVDLYYVKNGKYSTCNLDEPHFYILASKLKVIPDNKIICGPACLFIGDVPTPLVLPFGFFPNTKGRKSGIILPAYGESQSLGYFLTGGGYYFGLSDFFDLALRGDIYSQGSFGVKANSNYNKRYKYNGFISLNFSDMKISEKEFPDYSDTKTFLINWQHTQDVKANPDFRFSANVNAGSAKYNTYNSYDPSKYLQNTMASNISLSKSWAGTPFNLSLNAAQTQNTITKTMDLTLPEATFSVNRIYPFKRAEAIGAPKWYEKIGISATVNAENKVSTYDSLLFKTTPNSIAVQPNAYKMFQNGLKTSVPISTSFNVGPIIFTPSANFNSEGYFQTTHKFPDKKDSAVVDSTFRKFATAYDYNVALSATTKLYGMYLFKHGRLKAIRHVLTPSISLTYRPDFSEPHYGFYQTVTTHPEGVATTQTYSYFQNGIYGTPPAGNSGLLNLSLANNLEMKLRPSKKDTSTKDKKIMLIDNFTIATSYNVAVTTFNWSNITVNGVTKLFKKVDLNLNAIIDPYKMDYGTGKDINRLLFDETYRIGRITTASLSVSTSLRSLMSKDPVKPTQTAITPAQTTNYDQLNYILLHPDYYVDFKVPWNLSVYYNVISTKMYIPSKQILKDSIIQALTFSGDVNVTKKWKVGFHSGFDFVAKNFTYTTFDIYRDLHCWEMRLNWVPFGPHKMYMITLAVKASTLQDLKLMRKRDWYDTN
jgi:hypothetical protein